MLIFCCKLLVMTDNDFDIKQPAPENARITSDLTALSKTMAPLTKQLFGKKGFVEVSILTNWDKIVGKELADFSVPQKIDFKREQKNNGILHLQVPSGAFALEIQHREKFILEKINAYFGYNAVSGLKIVQNATISLISDVSQIEEEPQNLLTEQENDYIQSLSQEIKSSKLKEILIKLGHCIFNDNHKKEK